MWPEGGLFLTNQNIYKIIIDLQQPFKCYWLKMDHIWYMGHSLHIGVVYNLAI